MAWRPIPLRLVRRRVKAAVLRPLTLACLPALLFAGYWLGGEVVLMIAAVSFPLVLLCAGLFEGDREHVLSDGLTGLANREHLVETLTGFLENYEGRGQSTVAMVIQLDDFSEAAASMGRVATDEVLCRTAERILAAIRPGDLAARLVEHRFALALGPVRRANLEVALQVSERIQAAIAEPISLRGGAVYVTASVGFCLARRAPRHDGEAMLEAAEIAMDEARRAGHGAIRAYSPEMGLVPEVRQTLSDEIAAAFDAGQIRPWFQPQVSTDTGRVSGFEALARWTHPVRGTLPPGDFLEAVENSGMQERLGEAMVYHSLSALRTWDKSGYRVPRIGLNFSALELRNPRLVDRIRWELDRFDLTADRLTIEISETVAAETGNETVLANVQALAMLGCEIDLDDFGATRASIPNIRRFAIGRVKIDRSLVSHVDLDPERQRMLAAILAMAERLDLRTLAEGVETHGEHNLVAQLGCDDVQGFGIAPPMPFEETMTWMDRLADRIGQVPRIEWPIS